MRKSVVLLLVFFSLMGLCAVEVKSVSAVAEDSWMSLTPMPTAPNPDCYCRFHSSCCGRRWFTGLIQKAQKAKLKGK